MKNRDNFNAAFQSVRPKILERDGNCCVKCKSTLSLEVNHLEGYTNNEPEFLVTLCNLCHGVAPMEKDTFEQWLALGESGTDVLKKRLAVAGVRKMSHDEIVSFCEVLSQFGLDTNKLKLKTARDRLEKAGLIKYGRKQYGEKFGEKEILDDMKDMASHGKAPQIIANELNKKGIPSRYGKLWSAQTVAKILVREGSIKSRLRIARRPSKRTKEIDLDSINNDEQFWVEIEKEVARGPLAKPKNEQQHTKLFKPPYVLKNTPNGRILVSTKPTGDTLIDNGWRRKTA